MDAVLVDRRTLIDRLEWASPDSSSGYGNNLGEAMLWEMDCPRQDKPDLKSTVVVFGPPSKYTTEELAQIVVFADSSDAEYDRMFCYRRGCNMTVFDKLSPTRWLRKRLSWYMGPLFSESLEDAIKFMSR